MSATTTLRETATLYAEGKADGLAGRDSRYWQFTTPEAAHAYRDGLDSGRRERADAAGDARAASYLRAAARARTEGDHAHADDLDAAAVIAQYGPDA